MSIPANIIVAWSGAINEIPSGWLLCDGTNDTPDLRNRFIVGGGSTYELDDIGGSANTVNIEHTHTNGSTSSSINHTHNLQAFGGGQNDNTHSRGTNPTNNTTSGASGVHTHSFNTTNAGESGVNKNLPPYFALAFIMYEGE